MENFGSALVTIRLHIVKVTEMNCNLLLLPCSRKLRHTQMTILSPNSIAFKWLYLSWNFIIACKHAMIASKDDDDNNDSNSGEARLGFPPIHHT